MKTKTLTTIILLLTIFVSACTAAIQTPVEVPPQLEPSTPVPTTPVSGAPEEPTKLPTQAEAPPTQLPTSTPADFTVEVVAEGLDIPWEVAFLPDGDMLVTERSGSLIRIGQDRKSIDVEGVYHIGEGGLLGLALHPDFENNATLYLYLTSQVDGAITNRVESYMLIDDRLENRTVILDGIPGAANHDGGRIEFGPDGYLYITTGDAGKPESAQDINSLAGKILRVTETGAVPEDNPFQSPVYSYGHRNPQGLAWDDSGRLWSTEHGRSGFASGFDELNLVEVGKNYGWPVISHGQEYGISIQVSEGSAKAGMEQPVVVWLTRDGSPHIGLMKSSIAPSGLAFYTGDKFPEYRGNLFSGALAGTALWRIVLNPDHQTEQSRERLLANLGERIRDVRQGPDGWLYLLTDSGKLLRVWR